MQPILVNNFLPEDVFLKIKEFVANLEFEDGGRTAHGKAREAKHNLQAAIRSPKDHLTLNQIISFFMATQVMRSHIFARRISTPMINKYQPGMAYKEHIDRAFMRDVRTDFSFTYFLTDPKDYEGGELQIMTDQKTVAVKGEANSIVLYESLQKHQVAEVIKGERVSIVGWVESCIANEEKRTSVRKLQSIYKQMDQGLDRDQHDQLKQDLNLQIQKVLRFFSE